MVPLFVALEFEETHSGNEKWSLSYLVSLKWLLWISLAGCATVGVLSLPMLVMGMAGREMKERKEEYVERWKVLRKQADEAFAESGWLMRTRC